MALGADSNEFTDTYQRLGGFSLWRKSPTTLNFASEWLRLACDPQLISDAPNRCGLPNYPEFVAHRHDQSIFSLLAKQHGLPAFRDPSQWGNDRLEAYPNSPYPQLIELTRERNIPLRTRVKRSVKSILGLK